MSLIAASLIVFAITLIITKSRVLASKREFVDQSYKAAKLFEGPSWIHRIWHAIWTCSMCCGFWISLLVCLHFPEFGYFYDVLIVFGLNWLWHCLESILFYGAKLLEMISEPTKEEENKKEEK